MGRFWGRRRERAERELDAEIRSTLAMLGDEGLDARGAALALGGEEQVKEAVRAARRGAWREALGRDLRQAARRLWRRPGYSLAVILVLGVGIGLTTALFTAVQALVLRPLPFPEPQQLVELEFSAWELTGNDLIAPQLKPPLRPVFSNFAGYQAMTVNIADGGPPERMRIAAVSAHYFAMLGVRLERGWGFAAGDFQFPARANALTPLGPAPVVLSDALWHARYGAAPNILGRVLQWGGASYRVVGIAPPAFDFPQGSQAWIPFRNQGSTFTGVLDNAGFPTMLGRLRPGLSLAAAEQQVAAWARGAKYAGRHDSAYLVPLHQYLLGDRRGLVLLLWAASGLVLLLACAGALGLGAGQTWTRRRELALRMAIGASARRLRWELMAEGLMLGLTGGLLGWGLAWLAASGMTQYWQPMPAGIRGELGLAAAAVTVGLALACGVAVGLAGNSKQWRLDSENFGRGAGPARTRGREWLTAAQLTLALALLTATVALARSWLMLTRVPTGINPHGMLAMEVALPNQDFRLLVAPRMFQQKFGAHPERATAEERARNAAGEAVLARVRAFQGAAARRVSALPGVQAAGVLGYLPFGQPDLFEGYVRRPGPEHASDADGNFVTASQLAAGPGALTALGMHFMAGRDFRADDAPGCEEIFNVSLMRAMGYRSMPATVPAFPHTTCRLVGVVADVKLNGLRSAAKPAYYVQLPVIDTTPFLIVRAAPGMAPQALLPSIRNLVNQLAPGTAISHVSTLDDLLSASHAHLNQASGLFGLFALLAAAIAGLSVFALAWQTAAGRTREIGVRMALGAAPGDIRRWMLRRPAAMTAGALAAAFPLAWLLERSLQPWLYHVTPGSGLSYAWAALALAGVVLASTWWPARMASRVAPMEALRRE